MFEPAFGWSALVATLSLVVVVMFLGLLLSSNTSETGVSAVAGVPSETVVNADSETAATNVNVVTAGATSANVNVAVVEFSASVNVNVTSAEEGGKRPILLGEQDGRSGGREGLLRGPLSPRAGLSMVRIDPSGFEQRNVIQKMFSQKSILPRVKWR
jgi:hypothetical protein